MHAYLAYVWLAVVFAWFFAQMAQGIIKEIYIFNKTTEKSYPRFCDFELVTKIISEKEEVDTRNYMDRDNLIFASVKKNLLYLLNNRQMHDVHV